MSLAPCVIGKRGDNTKRCRSQPHRETYGSRLLFLDLLEAVNQQGLKLTRLVWLCFNADQQTNRDHLPSINAVKVFVITTSTDGRRGPPRTWEPHQCPSPTAPPADARWTSPCRRREALFR